MRSSRIRSLLLTAVLLACCGLGWFYLAPTQIGGSTHYVITHGISMEPMLHTGDLALVRPVDDYRVGQVAAYHSTLLNTVVLHRIIRIAAGHYYFKGDNNDFVDPTHPTRSMLIGAMWVHIPHAGMVLNWIHKPWLAAALTGGVAMMLLFGSDQRRRRRRRGRQQAARGIAPPRGPRPVPTRSLPAAAAVIALLFAGLGVYAFTQQQRSTTTTAVPYTQQVSFGYRTHVRPGPVYPNGTVTTGDPLYSPLVRHLTVTAAYRLSSTSSYSLSGSVRLRGTVANTSGWSRSFWLGPAARISAGHALARGEVQIARLSSLVNTVAAQVGLSAGSYALTIVPHLRLSGEVGGHPLSSIAQPSLNLDLSGSQLLAGSSASAPAGIPGPGSNLVHTTNGDVTAERTATNKLGPAPIGTIRPIAIARFSVFALLALLLVSRARGASPDPIARINARYKHLIVPVAEIHTDPDHPPIEVRTIEALAHLAERSERLILHDHRADADNYLIDDQGTLFRFQALRVRDTNGNGSAEAAAAPEPQRVPPAAASPVTEAGPKEQETGATAVADAAISSNGTAAAVPLVDEPVPPSARVHTFEPLSNPKEDAEAIRLSNKVTPAVQGPQQRRPPMPTYTHWSQRPEVRVGFTLGPLLTLLALRRVRAKRAESRLTETEQQSISRDRWRADGHLPPHWPYDRRQPQRAPGDRRRGDRRRNQ
jgi:signal peptidase I